MSEWWTYRPSDFLMFSARTYGRLLESVHQDAWPLQPLLLAAGLALVVLAWCRPVPASRWVATVLALAWAWVAWNFHWSRFAAVNTAAAWFALAFSVQAALLMAGALRARSGMDTPHTGWRMVGITLALLALLAYPLVAPMTGRGWSQAEVAGLMPEPTALLTVGLLMATAQRLRWLSLALPLLALAVGWTTAWLLWGQGS